MDKKLKFNLPFGFLNQKNNNIWTYRFDNLCLMFGLYGPSNQFILYMFMCVKFGGILI